MSETRNAEMVVGPPCGDLPRFHARVGYPLRRGEAVVTAITITNDFPLGQGQVGERVRVWVGDTLAFEAPMSHIAEVYTDAAALETPTEETVIDDDAEMAAAQIDEPTESGEIEDAEVLAEPDDLPPETPPR